MGLKRKKALQVLGAFLITIFSILVIICTVNVFKNKAVLKSVKKSIEYSYQANLITERRLSKIVELEAQALGGSNIEEKLCQLEIEEGYDKIKVSSAYACLMRIHAIKQNSLDLYKAIEMGSYALDVGYSSEYMRQLYSIITQNKYNNINFKDSKAEVEFLEKLLDDSSIDVKAMALNRLSMIYKLGRASSLQPRDIPDMKSALNYRLKMMELFKNAPKKKKLDIAVIINDGYAEHAAVTLASALMNAEPDTFYNFYFVENPEDPISEQKKKMLLELKKINDNCDIIFKPFPNKYIDENFFKQSFRSAFSYPYLIIYRLFLDQLFSELKSIIYLDSDLIIRRDLNILNDSSSRDYPISAVSDIAASGHIMFRQCRELSMKSYVNSGVLVLNLEKMRDENSAQNIIDAISTYNCPLTLFDQDVINYVYQGKTQILSNRWNMAVGAHLTSEGSSNNFANFITHFIGGAKGWEHNKPWQYQDAKKLWKEDPKQIIPEFWEYWAYRDITPFTHLN